MHFKAAWGLIFLLNVAQCVAFMHHGVVKEFFKKRFINQGIVLTCSNKEDKIKLSRQFFQTNSNLMLSIHNVNKPAPLDQFLIRHGRIGIVLDENCHNLTQLMTWFGRHRLFDIKYYWLIISSKSTNVKDIFSQTEHNLDSNIYVATNAIQKDFDLFEFYNPASKKGGQSILNRIGVFRNDTGIEMFEDKLMNKFWHRRDLKGVQFKTTVVFHEPYYGTPEEYFQNLSHKEVNTYNRFFARLMLTCQKHYQFSYKIVNVTTLFGYRNEDGTMNGLVGDLERRIVDFGFSPLYTRSDRASVITYGRTIYHLTAAFLFINPKSKAMFKLFLRPLDTTVWYCLLGFVVLISMVIKLISTLDMVPKALSSWTHSVLCVIGIFSSQGSIVKYENLSGRIALIFALILAFLGAQVYSGSLVSSLLNVPLDTLDSVEDLLDSKFKIGIENTRFNKEFFKFTVDNASIKLHETLVVGKENEVYQNYLIGLRQIEKGRYAFHAELAKAYRFLRATLKPNKLCEIGEVVMFKGAQCHANYVKHSPFSNTFDVW
ncbi:glutamate receptor ionotropic, delta-2-like [Anthonomus grandis grandis]|uniref:glutamate receptor ionotropic, delta-2-like n=1 Tax=Anthonomus grandis grandis TaxID=2921223 RepID=UPI0021663702|nr:glutamate receptor ionotropic, delta-2-like [Anthonomus grandis grandis]